MARTWVNFKAGALSKKVGITRVSPYLIDISEKTEVTGPLTKFQMKKANVEDTFSLVNDINKALGEGKLPDSVLNTTFERFWPDLEKVIAVPPAASVDPPKRTERELLEEILERARSTQQQVSKFTEAETTRRLLNDLLSARGLSRKTFRSIPDAILKEWVDEEMSHAKIGESLTNLQGNEKKNGEDDEK
jgi:hypothetical protein